jgi:hypothetical protein
MEERVLDFAAVKIGFRPTFDAYLFNTSSIWWRDCIDRRYPRGRASESGGSHEVLLAGV